MLDCRRRRWTVLGGLIISPDAQSDPGLDSFGRSVAQWRVEDEPLPLQAHGDCSAGLVMARTRVSWSVGSSDTRQCRWRLSVCLELRLSEG